MKKLLTKVISILCTAAMLCAAFTGCGSNQKVPEPTDALSICFPMQRPTLMTAYTATIKENSGIKAEYDMLDSEAMYLLMYGKHMRYLTPVEELNQSNARLKLNEYYDALKNSLMKGGAKDVVFADAAYQTVGDVPVLDYNKMIQGGAFVNLAPIFEKYAPDTDLTPFDSLRAADGALYAVPILSDPFHLQGAQSVLDAWDFSYHPEENILEFLRRCKEWQDAHKDDPEAPAVFSQYAWEYLEQNLFSIIGADCIDYDKKTAEISVPEIVEIMSLLRDLQSDVVESVFVFPNEIEEQYGAFLFGGYLGAYDVTMYAEDNGVRDGLVSAHPEHRTALMPLRTLDGKVNAGAQFYLMVPAMASNQVNGVKYIAQLLKIMQEDEMFTSNIGFVEYPANAGTEQVKKKNQTLSSYGNAEFSEVFERIYADRGAIRMPDYWMPGAQSLLDNYMKGSCSPEDVVKQLDERLKIYVSE